jgi:type IV pilus assembly protein PilM
VKLVQFCADRQHLQDASRWEVPLGGKTDLVPTAEAWVEALKHAREGHQFRGRDAVICLTGRNLFLQNIRVPKVDSGSMQRVVTQEIAGRLPYPVAEAEIRYLEAADVRQGGSTMREVVVMACERTELNAALEIVIAAGLRPVAVDVEPAALLRSCVSQYRRDDDQRQRTLCVHLGYSRSVVVIAEGDDVLFIKYLDQGGRQMDHALAGALSMPAEEASALRRHNFERRSTDQDPELTRSISTAMRGAIDQLSSEISRCIRYHSVTFRGKPLARMVIGGGEANAMLFEELKRRIDMPCELSEPFRHLEALKLPSRAAGWDIAAGLAMRNVN